MLVKAVVPTYYRTMTIYEVKGDISLYTDEALINFCDYCNFGGSVTRKSENLAIVLVHID
jgi:hypothetical protein